MLGALPPEHDLQGSQNRSLDQREHQNTFEPPHRFSFYIRGPQA